MEVSCTANTDFKIAVMVVDTYIDIETDLVPDTAQTVAQIKIRKQIQLQIQILKMEDLETE